MRWHVPALARAQALVRRAVEERRIPGAVVAVGQGAEEVWRFAAGWADATPGRERPMREDTVFDLASLTKVVVTLPLVLGLVEEGLLALDDPVQAYLPEFAGPDKGRVRIRHLLAHTGGLAWHREFYRTRSGPDVLAAAMAEPLVAPPGETTVYSDLGFMLLGEVVRRVRGQDLDAVACRLVFEPLGMGTAAYRPPPAWRERIAATEAAAGGGGAKTGVVHDDNAEAMGGVSGHAGLFASAADLGRYAAAWLGAAGEGWLSPAVRALALRPATPPPARRGLGWVLRGDEMDFMGDLWPDAAFGHTGFTGTSLAVDPGEGMWAVVLTNRVHLGRAVDIGPFRARLHNALAGAWR